MRAGIFAISDKIDNGPSETTNLWVALAKQ